MTRAITFNLLDATIKPQLFHPAIWKPILSCHSSKNTHKQGQYIAPDPNNVIFIALPVFGESSASIWKYLQPFPATDPEIARTERKPKLHGVYCHFRRKKVFEKVYSGSQGKLSGRHLPFHQSVGDSHSCHKWLVSFDAKNNTIFLPEGLLGFFLQ